MWNHQSSFQCLIRSLFFLLDNKKPAKPDQLVHVGGPGWSPIFILVCVNRQIQKPNPIYWSMWTWCNSTDFVNLLLICQHIFGRVFLSFHVQIISKFSWAFGYILQVLLTSWAWIKHWRDTLQGTSSRALTGWSTIGHTWVVLWGHLRIGVRWEYQLLKIFYRWLYSYVKLNFKAGLFFQLFDSSASSFPKSYF